MYEEVDSMDPRRLVLGTKWRGKGLQYPLDRRLGGPHSRAERRGEVKILDHTETRTPTKKVTVQGMSSDT
jgi:hypothetical protein